MPPFRQIRSRVPNIRRARHLYPMPWAGPTPAGRVAATASARDCAALFTRHWRGGRKTMLSILIYLYTSIIHKYIDIHTDVLTTVQVSSKAFATTICLLQKCLLDKPSIEQTMCPSIVELSKFGPYSSYQNDNLRNAIEVGCGVCSCLNMNIYIYIAFIWDQDW